MSQREAVCAPNDEIFHPISIPVCSYYYSSAMLNSSSSRLFHPPLPAAAAAATATATATQQPTHPISHLSHPQLVPHVIPRCPLTPTHSITTSISSILDPTPDSSAYFRINPEEEDCTAGETYKGGGYEQIVGQKWECRCIWRPCPEGEEEKRDSRE